MSARGIDYAWARPDPAQVRARGYDFVCRYLSHDASKDISGPEAQALINAGLAVVLVWETTAARAADGHDAGVTDAQEASRAAYSVGQPEDRPIYFAVDFDAAPSAIAGYFAGVVSVLGRARTGVYGGYKVVKALLDGAVVGYAWQTLAWSGGQVDSRVNLYQTGETDFGQQADVDEAYQPDYGQWPYHEEDELSGEGPEILQRIKNLEMSLAAEVYIPMLDGSYQGKDTVPFWNDENIDNEWILVWNLNGVGATVTVMDTARNIIGQKTAPMGGQVIFSPSDLGSRTGAVMIEASEPVVVSRRSQAK